MGLMLSLTCSTMSSPFQGWLQSKARAPCIISSFDEYFRQVRQNLDYLTLQVVDDMFSEYPMSNSWHCCLCNVIEWFLIGFTKEYNRDHVASTKQNNPDFFFMSLSEA